MQPPAGITAIERALDSLGDDFNVFSSRNSPPTEAAIVAAEAALGRTLPTDYREFVAYLGALVVEVAAEVWERPKEFDVRPAWQMDFARMVFGVASDLPAILSVTKQAEEFAATTDDSFLPVLRRNSGNGDVHGYDAEDAFVLFDHETRELQPADDFVTTLLGEIETLRHDRDRLRDEPIAKSEETSDVRPRHVVTLSVDKRPGALLSSLRGFSRALEREFPTLEVSSEHDDVPFVLAADPLPRTFLDGSGGSLDFSFAYGRSGSLEDDYELYVYDNRSTYSLIFRTIAPVESDAIAAKGLDCLIAALDAAELQPKPE